MSKSLILLFIMGAVACNLLRGTPPPVSPSTTPTLPPPSPTPSPAPSPTATAETLLSQADFDNLALQRQAMLPEFGDDVDMVAATGASRYRLTVRLESDRSNNETAQNETDQNETAQNETAQNETAQNETAQNETAQNETDLILSGAEKVLYTNTETEPLSEIYFRLYPNLPSYGGQMRVDMITIDGQPVEGRLEAERTALHIPLNPALAPGAAIEINLSYQTTVPQAPETGYNVFSNTDGVVALAGFYPAVAVYDDDGWNIEIPPAYGDATYLDVSLYQVELTVPEDMVVAASGSLIEETAADEGTKTLNFVSGPMRDFYVVMGQDYRVVSEMVDGVLVNSYYPPELEAGGLLALRYAADALRVFNDQFGPYPYAELDVAATPTRAGGVEYPGVIVVTQAIYDQAGGFFQHATAHEVAHQWWYGLVGNDQIDDPWLDESLTNYSTVLYWEEIEGPQVAAEIIQDYFIRPYELAQDQNRDRAVIGPVSDFSAEEYGLFVYGKGPLFFEALRAEVGDETYFEIMHRYYTTYKYKIAQPDDLLALIERVSGQEIGPLVETWLQEE